MRPCGNPKPTPWPNLATFFDLRSMPGQVPWGRWRYLENVYTPEEGKLSRMHGWRRLSLGHENSDLHNQMIEKGFGWDPPSEGNSRVVSSIGFANDPILCGSPRVSVRLEREPLTSGYLHEAPDSSRRLFVGCQSRIYSQRGDGGWRLLLDNRGGEKTNPAIRFSMAGLLNTVVATNNLDEPVFHILDSRHSGCDAHAFHPAPQLQEIGVTAAAIVVEWNNTLFLFNVVMDGVRVAHRAVWCNANSPFEWSATANDSTAGFYDLDAGEVILASGKMNDGLYVFTNRAIWRASVQPGGAGFTFQRIYHSKNGDGCIKARGSLAIWKDTAFYWGDGTIYAWSPFSPAPEIAEWMDRGTKPIQDSNPDCNAIVAGFIPGANGGRYLISWPEVSGELQSRTIQFDLMKQTSSVLDYGMTMMLSVELKQEEELVWWLVRKGICSEDDANFEWTPFKEDDRLFQPAATVTETPIYSHLKFEPEPGIVMEDYTKAQFIPAGGSVFCNEFNAEDKECRDCADPVRFIFASPVDFALKEFDENYFARDEWVNGVLTQKGYGMRMVAGAIDYGASEMWKRFQNPILFFDAVTTDEPREIVLRVGKSGEPQDPIAPRCRISWLTLKPRVLACRIDDLDGAPNAQIPWPLLIEGRYLYLDFRMAAVIGGAVDMSGLVATVSESPQTGG